MSDHLGDVFSKNTKINHIQSRKYFKHRESSLLPLLDEAPKKQRAIWNETFWFFWKYAHALSTRINMIPYQIYEMWFYVVVTRSKDKVVIFIEL